MDLESILIIAVCLFGPAAVILTIFSVQRNRRGKFPRQRITKGIKTRRVDSDD